MENMTEKERLDAMRCVLRAVERWYDAVGVSAWKQAFRAVSGLGHDTIDSALGAGRWAEGSRPVRAGSVEKAVRGLAYLQGRRAS